MLYPVTTNEPRDSRAAFMVDASAAREQIILATRSATGRAERQAAISQVDTATPVDIAIHTESVTRVSVAMRSLEGDKAEALSLTYFRGLTTMQAAEQLVVSPVTLDRLISAAKQDVAASMFANGSGSHE